MSTASGLDQLLAMDDAAPSKPVPAAQLEVAVLNTMRGSSPSASSRSANAFPSVSEMGALAPIQRVARKVEEGHHQNSDEPNDEPNDKPAGAPVVTEPVGPVVPVQPVAAAAAAAMGPLYGKRTVMDVDEDGGDDAIGDQLKQLVKDHRNMSKRLKTANEQIDALKQTDMAQKIQILQAVEDVRDMQRQIDDLSRQNGSQQRLIDAASASKQRMFDMLLGCSCMTCNAGCDIDHPPVPPEFNEKPIDIRCTQGHGQCYECAEGQVVSFCRADTELLEVKCTHQGCEAIINDDALKKLSSEQYAEYICIKAERKGAREAKEVLERETAQLRQLGMCTVEGGAPSDGTLVTLVQMASSLRTPCCNTPIIGFDGCAALECNNLTCKKHFCAWCFAEFNTTLQAHSHIREGHCDVAPDRAYYFETSKKRNQLRVAWHARQFKSLAEMRRLDLAVVDPMENCRRV